MPRQLDGWSCFTRKEQQAWTTDDNCNKQEADNRDSMVSSLSSRRPDEQEQREIKLVYSYNLILLINYAYMLEKLKQLFAG